MENVEKINKENKKLEIEKEKRTKKENKSYHAALTLIGATLLISFTDFVAGLSGVATNSGIFIMQIGALSVIPPTLYSYYQIKKLEKIDNKINLNNETIEKIKQQEENEIVNTKEKEEKQKFDVLAYGVKQPSFVVAADKVEEFKKQEVNQEVMNKIMERADFIEKRLVKNHKPKHK